MKTTKPNLIVVAMAFALVVPFAQAADLIWDSNAGTFGQIDGGGTWRNANQWWDGTTTQVTGTWGSTASTADNKNDNYFIGEGLLYVGIDLSPSGSVIIIK